MKLGIIGGFTSVLLVGLLGQSRIVFAMAKDGMMPAVLGRLHPTRQTPWVANLVFMVATAGFAAFVPIEALAKLVSVGTLLAFAIVCGGVLVLRRREPDRERPFRVPGSPVVPLLGIASCLLLMVSLPWQTWAAAGGVVRARAGGVFRLQPSPRRSCATGAGSGLTRQGLCCRSDGVGPRDVEAPV